MLRRSLPKHLYHGERASSVVARRATPSHHPAGRVTYSFRKGDNSGELVHQNSFIAEYNKNMNTRLQKIEQLCRKYQVKALYGFGSRSAEMLQALQDDAYGVQPLQSDLDIGALTHTPFSVDDKVSLTLELEELFNVPRVDLVILQEADAFLAANVIRGERIYSEDSYLADEYDLFVLGYVGELIEIKRNLMNEVA